MNRRTFLTISVVALCVVALCMSLTKRKVSAQDDGAAPLSLPTYNPYPPGILPTDLNSETSFLSKLCHYALNVHVHPFLGDIFNTDK